ncbi:hypothetical protein ACUIAK_15175 [Bacillus cytotoxicus]
MIWEGKEDETDGAMDVKVRIYNGVTGSAIGLGAIWKFPYIAGKSGGGAFFFNFYIIHGIDWAPFISSGIYDWS